MCDRARFIEARRNALALRYRCHAGLTEFIVPVVRNGEIVALLQCGQVHDRRPTAAEWRATRQHLVSVGIDSGPLKKLFQRNRVLPHDRQADLLNLLELVANRLSHADEHRLLPEPGRPGAQLGRAVTFIEVHLGERLTWGVIARAAGVSTRSLARLFRKEVGTSVVEFILRRRIARAGISCGAPTIPAPKSPSKSGLAVSSISTASSAGSRKCRRANGGNGFRSG